MGIDFEYSTNDHYDTGESGDAIEEITLMAWIKLESFDGTGESIIIGAWGDSDDHAQIGISDDGAINMRIRDANDNPQHHFSDNGEISLDTLYHIAGTWKRNGSTYIYKNGELIKTITGNVDLTIRACSQSITIGKTRAAGRYYDGIIYDARYYESILTADEIKSVYNGKGNDCIMRGLKMMYPMLVSGGAAAPSTIPDISINQNNATKGNSPQGVAMPQRIT